MRRLWSAFTSWIKSLVGRLTVGYLVLAWAVLGLVSGLAYGRAAMLLQAVRSQQLATVADLSAAELKRQLEAQRRSVVFLASLPEVRARAAALLENSADPGLSASGPSQALALYLTYWATGDAVAPTLFIAGLDGKIAVATDPARVGGDISQQPYFVAGRVTTTAPTLYLSPLTRRPAVTLATPVYDQNKQPVAVLAAEVQLTQLTQGWAGEAGLGTTGEIYLVSPAHQVVSAPGKAAGLGRRDSPARSPGIEAALLGGNGQGVYVNYAGQPVVGAYRWLADEHLALLVEMETAEALAPARDLAWLLLGVGGAALLATGAVVYGLARQAVRPLRWVTETARRVAAGDLALRAPVLGDDETAALAQAFNEMTAQLTHFIENLEGEIRAGNGARMPAGETPNPPAEAPAPETGKPVSE